VNQVLELISRLSTTRRKDFGDRQVPESQIRAIRQVITKTANSSNRQAYSVIVLDRGLAEALHLAGSHAFVFCVDFHRTHRLAERLGRSADTCYLMQLVTASIDVAMLAQSAIVAAQSLGVATWITNEIYHHDRPELWRILDLPSSGVFPMLAVCFGYATESSGHVKGRLPESAIFHERGYREPDDAELDAWIARYDDPRAELGLTESWREQGYDHYLDWFLEKWAPVVGSRRQSDVMCARLRSHGMLDS
jgi:nitroreductase